MDKISVVVPVYNSESELTRCVDSILNQSYKNLEIILINDGSTDNSLEICKNYANKFNQIKVINQANKGQSNARNRGIREATGEYIGFVDSDDVIHPEMYEYLYKLLIDNKAAISAIQAKTIKDSSEINFDDQEDEQIEYVAKNSLLEDYMFDGLNKPAGQYSACRKLFSKKILTDVQFVEGKIFEDILFNYEALEVADGLAKSNQTMYYYLQDSGSTMRRKFSEKEMDLLYICDILIDKAKETDNQNLLELAETKKARSYFSLLAKIAVYGSNLDNIKLNEIKKRLIKGLRENYVLLIKSPIPLNRKLIITLFSASFDITTKVMKLIRK